MNWKLYKRKGSVEARPYIIGEDLAGISVSETDIPAFGGVIARNPENHADQWYINGEYFIKNYEVPIDRLTNQL